MQVAVGEIFDGKVTGITDFGAFVDFDNGKTGMVHISEISSSFIKSVKDHLSIGQEVKVKVLGVNEQGKISLSIKKAVEPPPVQQAPRPKPRSDSPRQRYATFDSTSRAEKPQNFEDMMDRFKKVSDEKITDLKRASATKHGGGYTRRGGGGK